MTQSETDLVVIHDMSGTRYVGVPTSEIEIGKPAVLKEALEVLTIQLYTRQEQQIPAIAASQVARVSQDTQVQTLFVCSPIDGGVPEALSVTPSSWYSAHKTIRDLYKKRLQQYRTETSRFAI